MTLEENNQSSPSRMRRYFFTGILVTAPIGLTLYIAWKFVTWVDRLIVPYLPPRIATLFPYDIPGIGLIAALVTLTVIGALMNGFLGKWFTKLSEAILNRLPVIRTIYTVIKQVLNTALADQSKAFKEAVLVEFPREGTWVLGFVTSRDHKAVDTALGQKMVSVLIPTTPTLTSGYVVFVPEGSVKPVSIPPEEALKLIISGGLIS
jgi:uncharacterized membrane protein